MKKPTTMTSNLHDPRAGIKIVFLRPEAAKVASLVKFSMLKKPRHDFEIKFFSTRFNTYVYCRVSFRAVDIIISKDEEIFGPKILMMETTIFFLSDAWRLSRNQFQPVWAETVENYPLWKLELLSPQNRYIGHKCGIWKMKKGFYWFNFLLNH